MNMGGKSAIFQWRQLRHGKKEGIGFKRSLESLLFVYPAGSPLFSFLYFPAPLSPTDPSINTRQGQRPAPCTLLCAEGGNGHRNTAAELPSTTSWVPVEVVKGVGSRVSTLWHKAASYWPCDFRHVIKLPEITSSSVK